MKYLLRDVTPAEMQCFGGIGCPAIYQARELTPKEMRCGIAACPGVYGVGNTSPNVERCIGGMGCPTLHLQGDSYLIVGKVMSKEEAQGISLGGGKTLADKIGEGEALVCVPKGLLAEINTSSK